MSTTVAKPETTARLPYTRQDFDEVDEFTRHCETPTHRFLRNHRGKLHLIAFVGALAWATPSNPQLLVGVPFIILGLALRAWASGYIVKNCELCTAGPYAYCRHPMYLGNFIVLAGICLAGNNVYLTVAGFATAALVYLFSIRREDDLLQKLFGERFEQYCQSTPRLLPRIGRPRLVNSTGHFAWHLAKYNGTVEQSVAVLLLIILFTVKAAVLAHLGIVYPPTYGLWTGPLG